MELIDLKKKVIKILGDFLERNKNYTIEVYIKNTDMDSYIEKIMCHLIGIGILKMKKNLRCCGIMVIIL